MGDSEASEEARRSVVPATPDPLETLLGADEVVYRGEVHARALLRLRNRPRVVITATRRVLVERDEGWLEQFVPERFEGYLPGSREPVVEGPLELRRTLVTGHAVVLTVGDGRVPLAPTEDLAVAIEQLRPPSFHDGSHLGTSLVAAYDGRSWTALSRGSGRPRMQLTTTEEQALSARLAIDGRGSLSAMLLLDDVETELDFDDAHRARITADPSELPANLFGPCTVPPRWLLLEGPSRIADRDYSVLAFPVFDPVFERRLERAVGRSKPRPTANSGESKETGGAAGLKVTVRGVLGDESLDGQKGRVVSHEQALALKLGKRDPIVLSDSRLTAAYVDGRYLFLQGEHLGLLCELESVAAGLAVSLHPVVRQHVARLDTAASLLAAIHVDDDHRGVAEVTVEDQAVVCHLPVEGELTLPFSAMRDIVVADGEVCFAVEGKTVRLQAAEQEVRQLLDRLWRSDVPVPARILLADFRHRHEREHFGLAQNMMRQVSEETLRETYETQHEKAARPDLLGKALRVHGGQLPGLAATLEEIAAVLGIVRPDAFVRNGSDLHATLEGWVHPRVEIPSRCLSVLGEKELEFHLGRCCAHLALDHLRGRVLGVEALRHWESGGELGDTALESTGAWVGAALGTSVGLMAGGVGAPVGQRVGVHLGRMVMTMGASSGGVFDSEGELMVRRAHLFRWLRTSELSADAFGYLFCGDLEAAVRAVLLSVFGTPEVVDALELPTYIAQMESIESVEGPAALYSRLDEQLPYGPHRVAELMAFAASRRGVLARERMQKIRARRRPDGEGDAS